MFFRNVLIVSIYIINENIILNYIVKFYLSIDCNILIFSCYKLYLCIL